MSYLILSEHTAEHIAVRTAPDKVALFQAIGHSYKSKVIILSWGEAVRLANLILKDAKKEMASCRALSDELQPIINTEEVNNHGHND
ncbi:MAG: hypothetical protein A2Y59_06355 [Chloroflexi bacterium RBG_13_52_14]|nr:MAG: hypothetical protein A2Y59_06355 [Chloroflexi bacterium RBG_13_52_14]